MEDFYCRVEFNAYAVAIETAPSATAQRITTMTEFYGIRRIAPVADATGCHRVTLCRIIDTADRKRAERIARHNDHGGAVVEVVAMKDRAEWDRFEGRGYADACDMDADWRRVSEWAPLA
jgi:hypothetical protein